MDKITIKEINHSIYMRYFEDDDKLHIKYSLLQGLYSLHAITYQYIEWDEKVRDRILKTIRREQIKIENTKVKA